MAKYLVAVADSVFPNLDPLRAVLSTIDAELQLASGPVAGGRAEAGVRRRRAARHLREDQRRDDREDEKCRIISRFGIGVDNVDLDAATAAGIVVTKVPDYCIDEVSDHAMALLLRRHEDPAGQRAGALRPWKMPAWFRSIGSAGAS